MHRPRSIAASSSAATGPSHRAGAETLAYSFDDQIYTRFTEQLSAGAFTARFDRAGRSIPGVPAHQLLARVGYDQVGGR